MKDWRAWRGKTIIEIGYKAMLDWSVIPYRPTLTKKKEKKKKKKKKEWKMGQDKEYLEMKIDNWNDGQLSWRTNEE